MKWLEKYLLNIPREGEGGGGGPGGGGAPAWHAGMEAEILGHVQNLGWDKLDAGKAAAEAAKSHRELQKLMGVPKEQLLRLPKDTTNPAEWDPVFQRLGVPPAAKDYDLSGLKLGTADLPPELAETLRSAAFAARVPKDRIGDFAKPLLEHMGKADADKAAIDKAKFDEQMAALEKAWGPNKAINVIKADEGARRLGLTTDDVKSIGKVIGVDRTAEILRKIGVGTSEHTFVDGERSGNPTTMEGAVARMKALEGDKAWTAKLLAGDAAALAEFNTLSMQIAGYQPGT